MDAFLFCKDCHRHIRDISENTTGLIVFVKNMAESQTNKCPTCGRIDKVVLMVSESIPSEQSSTNDA